MQTEREKARQRILKRLRRMKAKLEQLVRDGEFWNEQRLDARPFDLGREKVAISLINRLLALAESDQNIPSDLTERLFQQLRED